MHEFLKSLTEYLFINLRLRLLTKGSYSIQSPYLEN